MIGGSYVIGRYQQYLSSQPSGMVGETAVERIRELEQADEKPTTTKIRPRAAEAKNRRRSTSKRAKPDVVQTTAALLAKETNAIQCGNQNSFNCRKPLQTLAKDCGSAGLSAAGVCIRKNYRTSPIIKR